MSRSHPLLKAALTALVLSFATACGGGGAAEGEHEEAAAEYERGPHRGRMLRDGDFSIEMTIFEDGVPPEFHIYAYRNDQPIDPREVQLSVALTRLGGRVDQFRFAPEGDFLKGDAVVTVEELAARSGTIPYEILCGFSERVPRRGVP